MSDTAREMCAPDRVVYDAARDTHIRPAVVRASDGEVDVFVIKEKALIETSGGHDEVPSEQDASTGEDLDWADFGICRVIGQTKISVNTRCIAQQSDATTVH